MKKMKANTPAATAILMERRDELHKLAMELKIQAEQVEEEGHRALRNAKNKSHEILIKANFLQKKADAVQACIDEEVQALVDESRDVLAAWSVKNSVIADQDNKAVE